MIKIWGWEKKPRTMLRFLKIGDIFCFKYDDYTFCFGRIMADVMFHIVEIFDYISDQPVISEEDILGANRLLVTPLDTYSLFDRRSEGEWRIIGHQEDYVPPEIRKTFGSFGELAPDAGSPMCWTKRCLLVRRSGKSCHTSLPAEIMM